MDLSLLTGGPARAYIDISSVLTEVGHLNGGIDINHPEPALMELMTDELGETPADAVFNGRQPDTAVVRLAEISLAQLERGIPNAVLITDSTTSTKKKVLVRPVAGTKLSAVAAKWVFKPIDPATGEVSTDANAWVTIPKGAVVGAVTRSFKKGEQQTLEITIRALPDPANDNATVIYGDVTATAA